MARKTKIVRKVTARYRGLDRSASKAVYGLESKIGELTRRLKRCEQHHGDSRVEALYKSLTPRNRRKFFEYGELLLGTPGKK